jgi:two-component system response regulator NreC
MTPPFIGWRRIQMKRKNVQLQDPNKPELSKREYEVIALLAKGNPNKIVADILGISVRTAEVHRAAVMHKLGLHSMSDLMLYAIRNKIIEP